MQRRSASLVVVASGAAAVRQHGPPVARREAGWGSAPVHREASTRARRARGAGSSASRGRGRASCTVLALALILGPAVPTSAQPVTGGIGGDGEEAIIGGGGSEPGPAEPGGGHPSGGSGPGVPSGPGGGSPDAGSGSEAAGGSGGPPDGGSGPPEGEQGLAHWAHQPRWGIDAESGQRCILLVRRPGIDPSSLIAVRWELQVAAMVAELRSATPGAAVFCPATGDGPDWVVPPASPQAVAAAFIRRYPMPRPDLDIPPGFALTGLTTYLLVDGVEGHRWSHHVPGWGILRVELASRGLAVDWGDGTQIEVEPGRRGEPHGGDPAQQIRHLYRDADAEHEVQVDVRWAATWHLAGFKGVIEGLSSSQALDLPVREYRAVRADPDS